MTNEELLDIDELMQGSNQARQHRADALWDAAKLERQARQPGADIIL